MSMQIKYWFMAEVHAFMVDAQTSPAADGMIRYYYYVLVQYSSSVFKKLSSALTDVICGPPRPWELEDPGDALGMCGISPRSDIAQGKTESHR